MESNKILIGVEFGYNSESTIGGFELMVLRDLTLEQLFEGIKIGLQKKLKSENEDERRLYEAYYTVFTNYCTQFDSVIITSSNKGIDTVIRISEEKGKDAKKLFQLGFITSTRIIFNGNGQAKVYSLNNPEAITPAFKEHFPEYNISSRQLSVIDTQPIKIIPAPEPPQKPQINVLAMILPSMAMTLVMVLGRTLFMGGSSVSTAGMIGLSLAMVSVNILVSLFNFRRQIKEHQVKLSNWKLQYENYINKTISKIEERQKGDAIQLSAEYPNIQVLFDDTMTVSDKIYSRDHNDSDFMTVRLGTSDEVDTLFAIEGDKKEAIFSSTKYKWENQMMKIVLFPEKVKKKEEKIQKENYDKVEDYLIDLPYDISRKYKKMKCGGVPLLLPLHKCGTLGVVSEKEHLTNRLMNSMIYELCFYHSPEDLQFIMFYDEEKVEDILSPDNTSFHKYKFVSHFNELFNNKSQFVYDEKNAKLMFDSLLNIIYERRAAKESSQTPNFTQIVVVVYEEYGIKEHAIANYLPNPPKAGEMYDNELGITYVFCKQYKEHLPAYCGNTIEIVNKDQITLTPRSDSKEQQKFINSVIQLSEDKISTDVETLDIIRKGDFYNRLKVLSAIYYTRIAQNAKVPSYITLFELLNINQENFNNFLHENWTSDGRPNIEKTLAIPIGRSENSIVKLDLHEKHDGPHMLVAGTTGSGKSETIISYLVGLCMYYTPEEINMLLIDMKGGGFIKRIGELPHVVGSVTDVDGDENGTGAEYMLKRFLDSLASEIKRRKIMFNQLGVDSIDGYIKKHKKLSALPADELKLELDKIQLPKLPKSLSHLIFVVDEFTELKRASGEGSDMDFIGEITTIARVGRSLGFHIILISQNIEGAITDDIRVNSKARLCLKVATKQASKEMIGNNKAAAPDMPGFGRAYMLVGTGTRFDYFQSAYSGAKSSQTLDMPFEIIKAEQNGPYTSFFDSTKDRKDDREIKDNTTQLEFVVEKIIEYYDSNIEKFGKPHIIFNQPLPKSLVYQNGSVMSKSDKMESWNEFNLNY